MIQETETEERPEQDVGLPEKDLSAARTLRARRRRLGWLALGIVVLVGIGLIAAWRATAPTPVVVLQPTARTVMETIAASGRVSARRDTIVGAQAQGVVAELWVDEGDAVRRGQALARVQNDVARAQVRQAEQGLQTSRALLDQAAAGARPSELNAARAQVAEALAVVAQRRAQRDQEQVAEQQAAATVRQRLAQVAQARATVTQAEARRDLARANRDRYRTLLAEGAIARQTVDQAESEYRAAEAEVAATREGVATAEANLALARAGVTAARRGVAQAAAGVQAARAAVAAARAQQRTIEAGPREEAVEVARRRLREAEAALRIAREQAQDAIVRAPFPGTVTAILAEPGAPVTPSGIVRLVQTSRPEILVDVDENDLEDLRVEQRAVVTSPTFRRTRLQARVTQIGAQINVARGTVEVTIVPEDASAASLLRPGQTVDVNIITAESVSRLVVPRSALRREGDHSVVLIIQGGRAVARTVIIGPVEGEVVPVLDGLSREDRVIRDAQRVEPGARVRVAARG